MVRIQLHRALVVDTRLRGPACHVMLGFACTHLSV